MLWCWSSGRPLTVLIDRRGTIAAITSPEQVNREILRRLLAGQPLPLRAPIDRVSAGGGDRGEPETFRAAFRVSPETSNDFSLGDGKFVMQGADLRTVLSKLYGLPGSRTAVAGDLSGRHYDGFVERPGASDVQLRSAAQDVLAQALGVSVVQEDRRLPVLVLTQGPTDLLGAVSAGDGSSSRPEPGYLLFRAQAMSTVTQALEHELDRIVVDQSGAGGLYSFDLRWDAARPETLAESVRTTLGLTLREESRAIPCLVVTRAP